MRMRLRERSLLCRCPVVLSTLFSSCSILHRVNKVGPYNNPQETYNFYYLPFCKRFSDDKAEHSWGGLGEVLQGNELINSQIDIRFKGERDKRYSFSLSHELILP